MMKIRSMRAQKKSAAASRKKPQLQFWIPPPDPPTTNAPQQSMRKKKDGWQQLDTPASLPCWSVGPQTERSHPTEKPRTPSKPLSMVELKSPKHSTESPTRTLRSSSRKKLASNYYSRLSSHRQSSTPNSSPQETTLSRRSSGRSVGSHSSPTRNTRSTIASTTRLSTSPDTLSAYRSRRGSAHGVSCSETARGNGGGSDGGRQMFDKRRLRRGQRDAFSSGISIWRDALSENLGSESSNRNTVSGQGTLDVFVRKRPLFEYEVQRGEFDVVTVQQSSNRVFLHSCLFMADLHRMFIKHSGFQGSSVFGEQSGTDDVYSAAAKPKLDVVLQGGIATLFMYGQTGSGKSYTMSGIEERLARDIFEVSERSSSVQVTFVELQGKRCIDLLTNNPEEISILETKKGCKVVLQGATTARPTSAQELLTLITHGHARRSTQATEVNSGSSRSHAVLTISVNCANGQVGKLTLVDCAGSERKEDSMHHNAERRREAAEINSSLFALKECMRFKAMATSQRAKSNASSSPSRFGSTITNAPPPVHIPFRQSNLTRVLMESFEDETASLAVIVTLSPGSSDCEHSLDSMWTVMRMCGLESEVTETQEDIQALSPVKPRSILSPKDWTPSQLRDWASKLQGGAFQPYISTWGPNLDGRALIRLSQRAVVGLCEGNQSHAQILFNAFRNEVDRVSIQITRQRIKLKNER